MDSTSCAITGSAGGWNAGIQTRPGVQRPHHIQMDILNTQFLNHFGIVRQRMDILAVTQRLVEIFCPWKTRPDTLVIRAKSQGSVSLHHEILIAP